jgi:zinc/manganese transport system permease protein
MGSALAAACAIGVGSTVVGVLLAYDSYSWGSSHHGYPVSFFIVALVFVAYLVSGWSRQGPRSAPLHGPARP